MQPIPRQTEPDRSGATDGSGTTQPQRLAHDAPAGEKKSAALAALLSCLYVGLGQIYNGQFLKGMSLALAPPATALGWLLVRSYGHGGNLILPIAAFAVMAILFLGLWVWSMADAFTTAERINHLHFWPHPAAADAIAGQKVDFMPTGTMPTGTLSGSVANPGTPRIPIQRAARAVQASKPRMLD